MCVISIHLFSGYPEHQTFGDFVARYAILSGADRKSADLKSVVEELLALVELDQSQYRVGLSQVRLSTS